MANSNLQKLLVLMVTEILQQGVDLLHEIEDRHYSAKEKDCLVENTAIGAHFRHCLEFVNGFLAGIENGLVDYEKRLRNKRTETERGCAIEEFLRTIQILTVFSSAESSNSLLVKPENVGTGDDLWCQSSIERELEFLQSHTIHHYALIAFKLRAMGVSVPAEFGIASSTLRYWKQEKSAVR